MGQLRKIGLKKVKASSLVETMVASVVIMVVFGICLATISNILEATVKGNTRLIDRELDRIEYLYRHDKIQAPDIVEFKSWQIQITREKQQDSEYIVLKATHKENGNKKSKQFLE